MTLTLATPTRVGRWALLWRLVVLCVAIRIVLEIIGVASLASHGLPVEENLIDMWNRWDAHHYLRLAEVGYVRSSPPPNTDDPLYIVFFPFYPLLVRLVALVAQDVVLSGLIVSFLASVGCGYHLFRLVALDSDSATAWRSVGLLFSFPTAYFMAAPFTEALFIFAVLWSVHSARTGDWALAGVAGALATGTRVTGLVLVPTLVVEVFSRRADRAEYLRRLAWAALSSVGGLCYLAINQVVHGDPLHFLEVQRSHWYQGLAAPWQQIQVAVTALVAGGNDFINTFVFVGRVVSVVIAVPLLIIAIRRLRPSDVVFGWAGLVLILSAAWLISLPRYVLVLYPLFIVGAQLTASRRVFVPVVVLGSAVQAWLMWRYASAQWTM